MVTTAVLNRVTGPLYVSLLATKVVIDKDALGWEEEHRDALKKYREVIGVSKHRDLPQRGSDERIAAYCIANDCDLVTADTEFYMSSFDAGAKSVRINRLGERGGKYIYLVVFEKNLLL